MKYFPRPAESVAPAHLAVVVVHSEGEDQPDEDGGPGHQQEQPEQEEGHLQLPGQTGPLSLVGLSRGSVL